LCFRILFWTFIQTPTVGDEVEEISLGYNETVGALKYKIYVTTFLGYGVNQAFEKYINRVITIALK
jgi:hypothetical protein